VEIANIGAYRVDGRNRFAQWYQTNADGKVVNIIPKRLGDGGIRTPNFTGHPARNELVRGMIQGKDLVQFDYTPGAICGADKIDGPALCQTFPKLKVPIPGGCGGKLIPHKLPDDAWKNYQVSWGITTSRRTKLIRARRSTGTADRRRTENLGTATISGNPLAQSAGVVARVTLQYYKKSNIFGLCAAGRGG